MLRGLLPARRSGGTTHRCAVTVVVIAAAVLAGVGVAAPARAAFNAFAVTSLGDLPDTNLTDRVCVTAGNSGCTLRAAIQQADADAPNGPDQILFTLPGTVHLRSALPDLTNSVDIVGLDSRNTVIRDDGTGSYRILTVAGAVRVNLTNLILSNGLPPVQADGCADVFASNSCGGAIYVAAGSRLNLDASSLTGNTADEAGGLFNGGTTSITGSTVGVNVAPGGNAFGGGLMNGSGAVLSVADTTFDTNQADKGGAVYSRAEVGASSTLTISNSTFRNNTATGAGGAFGGAVMNDGSTVVLRNSTFVGNRAIGEFAEGGAILVGQGSVTLTNLTVAGNSAARGGGIEQDGPGGGASIENTLVAGNAATVGPDIEARSPFQMARNNLIGDGSSSGLVNGTNGNQVGTTANSINPGLASSGGSPSLADNGGPTATVGPCCRAARPSTRATTR